VSEDGATISPEIADYCRSIVRESGIDAYLATLFLPADIRPYVYAFYAFDAEISHIRSLIKEPMMGEVRLQWWREIISGGRSGEANNNPVAAGLLAAINRFELPVMGFENYLNARVFDLYNDPMPDKGTLEGYAGETCSFLFFQISMMLVKKAGEVPGNLSDCAGHAGVVLVLTEVVKNLPMHRSRQQCYIPVSMLDEAGLTLEQYYSAENEVATGKLNGLLLAYMRHHISEFQKHSEHLPKQLKAVFLPMSLSQPYLARFEKIAGKAMETPVDIPQWRKQIYLWRAARNGTY